jgi:hypothetical protein
VDGARQIGLTEQEISLLQRLRADGMVEAYSQLDEHGWSMARGVLRQLAERRKYPMNNRKQANR